MEAVKTIDMELFFWIMGIVIALIGLLVAIIGYYIKKEKIEDDKFKDDNMQFKKEINLVLTNLDSTIQILNNELKNFNIACTKRDEVVDIRLNAHAKQLDKHEVEIEVLKVKTGK